MKMKKVILCIMAAVIGLICAATCMLILRQDKVDGDRQGDFTEIENSENELVERLKDEDETSSELKEASETEESTDISPYINGEISLGSLACEIKTPHFHNVEFVDSFETDYGISNHDGFVYTDSKIEQIEFGRVLIDFSMAEKAVEQYEVMAEYLAQLVSEGWEVYSITLCVDRIGAIRTGIGITTSDEFIRLFEENKFLGDYHKLQLVNETGDMFLSLEFTGSDSIGVSIAYLCLQTSNIDDTCVIETSTGQFIHMLADVDAGSLQDIRKLYIFNSHERR